MAFQTLNTEATEFLTACLSTYYPIQNIDIFDQLSKSQSIFKAFLFLKTFPVKLIFFCTNPSLKFFKSLNYSQFWKKVAEVLNEIKGTLKTFFTKKSLAVTNFSIILKNF